MDWRETELNEHTHAHAHARIRCIGRSGQHLFIRSCVERRDAMNTTEHHDALCRTVSASVTVQPITSLAADAADDWFADVDVDVDAHPARSRLRSRLSDA
jgi:hypothetical protein